MAINDYYGDRRGTTYLEIFSVQRDTEKRVIHRQLKDAEAYDTWHLADLFKEVLACRGLAQSGERINLTSLPRKEKNLLLSLMLLADPSMTRIMEIGSTLYEMIDGFELVNRYFRDNHPELKLDVAGYEYHGIEISALLRQAAVSLHERFKVYQYDSVPSAKGQFDLVYDRSVINYAFSDSLNAAAFVNQSRAGLLNTYFSLEDTFSVSRLGKQMTYLSLNEFIGKLDRPLFHLFGTKAPGPFSGEDLCQGRPVVEGFFMYGEESLVEQFMSLARRYDDINRYFQEKEIQPRFARELLK